MRTASVAGKSSSRFLMVALAGALAGALWALAGAVLHVAGMEGRFSPYFVYADMVRGARGARGPVGEQTNVFRRGEQVVWRAVVVDVLSGQMVGSRAELLGVKVTVHVEGGPSLKMRFEGQSSASGLRYWTASWQIPADYSTGAHRWWVEVTDALGTSARFEPIGIATEPTTSGLVVVR